MTFSEPHFGTHSALAQKLRVSFQDQGRRRYSMRLYATLVWAVCGHQLARVRDILVPCRDVARYCEHIPKMIHMRSVQLYLHDVPDSLIQDWTLNESESVRLDLEATLSFVNIWRAITTNTPSNTPSSSSFRQGRDGVNVKSLTDLQLVSCDDSMFLWAYEDFAERLTHLFRQMPWHLAPKIDCRKNLQWARFQLAPGTMDLGRVRTVLARDARWSLADGKSTMLQQCGAIRHLEITLQNDDGNAFARAVAEKGQRTQASTQPLAQLERLSLEIQGAGKWVRDALIAIGSTLRVLTLHSQDLNYCVDLAMFHSFPELRELSLEVEYLVNSGIVRPFSGCPKLWKIKLVCSDGSRSSLGQWDLSSVTDMSLCGPAAFFFEQASLGSMTKARRIELLVEDMDYCGTSSPLFSWDLKYWSLPTLQELSVSGSAAMPFQWSVLTRCFRLSVLALRSCPCRERRKNWPDLIIRKEDVSVVSSAMRHLELTAWELPGDTLYDRLPRMLPNLESVTFRACSKDKRGRRKRLQATFPNLKLVNWE
ncbi:hypothetical protein DFQ27_008035 [Actinomortierella ambigua]|uniref:Uncharacterized protein n=1 Tax=Actinomortierella ambigua TaxID=1343610 RepID=A0A9P6TZA1_9FUNG|nr:hypothetical protein DFQ27_008035 [Actinomortierella ambigua]